jgi:hypothetical protein
MVIASGQIAKTRKIDNLAIFAKWHSSCVVVGNQEASMWIDFLKEHYRVVQFVLLALWILMFPVIANSDDNFNFYFQKAPGPVVVNQGTRGPGTDPASIQSPKTAEAAAAEFNQGTKPAPAQVTANEIKPNEEAFRNWAVGVNAGYIRDGLRSSGQSMLGFDLEYSANRMLSFGGGMLLAHKVREKYNRSGTRPSGQDWHIRIGVTPFNLKMFEHSLLDIGFAAGLMSAYGADNRRQAEFFVGPSLDFNFSPMIALRSQLNYSFNKNYQALGGLRVRF